ncbi:hypothetical protein GCM10008090_30610 [Arenicella chitinivorans]|uniref:Uncharacterized protein n=1 Tax=Arenicella chitinivorans TaxID=1329800 RepID=A0A918S149_9GAMM|nr:hypothetical protein [Arenicella chitinivorans]GHA18853.1 hypothetical protein GCM10008090_30610 [Arenicella chitinivorans]
MNTHRMLSCALTLYIIGLSCFATPARAQSEVVTAAAKAVAQQVVTEAINYALGEVYDSSCSTPDNPRNLNGLEGFICNSAASMSGRKEEEFKNELREGLSAIKEVVNQVQKDIGRLQENQGLIINALSRIEAKVEAVPLETIAQAAVAEIQVLWNDHFLPVSNGTVSYTPQQLLQLANDIVFKHEVDRKLGTLSVAMTKNGFGNSLPLLTQQMNILLLGLENATMDDLETPYKFYQSAMSSALMHYGQGEMMYSWAVRMLEARCAVLLEQNKECIAIPTSSEQMRNNSSLHRTAMLDLFRNNVERLVLEHSSPSSLNRNFLHEDAITVFISADFFAAIHLPNRQGMRGRVISAGDAFSGTLSINNKRTKAKPPRTITSSADIDWWTRSAANQPYTEVHFAPAWRIYDVALDVSENEKLEIDSPLPWHTGRFELNRYDVQTGEIVTDETAEEGVITFGTFTAIARAGGAYAMMYNAWATNFSEETGPNNYGTRTQPVVIARAEGSVIYNSNKIFEGTAGKRDFDTTKLVRRVAPITIVDGGDITIHGHFGDAEAARARMTDTKRRSFIPVDAALYYDIDFRKSNVSSSSNIYLSTGAIFNREQGYHRLGWSHEDSFSSRHQGSVSHEGSRSTKVTYSAGTKLNVSLRALFRGTIYSTGWDATPYTLFAGIAPTALYFTRD